MHLNIMEASNFYVMILAFGMVSGQFVPSPSGNTTQSGASSSLSGRPVNVGPSNTGYKEPISQNSGSTGYTVYNIQSPQPKRHSSPQSTNSLPFSERKNTAPNNGPTLLSNVYNEVQPLSSSGSAMHSTSANQFATSGASNYGAVNPSPQISSIGQQGSLSSGQHGSGSTQYGSGYSAGFQYQRNQYDSGYIPIPETAYTKILEEMDSVRADVNARYMLALRWNESLAGQAWMDVKDCVYKNRRNGAVQAMIHEKKTGNSMFSEAVSRWSDEKNFFDPYMPCNVRNSCRYSQLVWATSREVGCARKKCNDMSFITCMYYPVGNTAGYTAYVEGTRCEGCKNSCNSDKLCEWPPNSQPQQGNAFGTPPMGQNRFGNQPMMQQPFF